MIYIDKSVTAENGAVVNHHQVLRVEVAPDGSGVTIIGASWANATLRVEGHPPLTQWSRRATFGDLGSNLIADIGRVLLAGGSLAGGSLIPGTTRTLAEAKLLRWSDVKRWRSVAISENLVTPYGPFQCAAIERTNITDAVLMLQTLASQGTPTTINFTLADNTTVNLNTTQMVTVGLLLGQRIQTAHATARALRAQIESATTLEAVAAVVWP